MRTSLTYAFSYLCSHPMHLHGFNMYILHEGPGAWDGTIIHPENPQRRDVFQVRKNGHLVIQFDAADNPGEKAHSGCNSLLT
jgi:FtsP/CotA-like multicopper oxidase with cupredoxin domain